jgi:hypothetical protein
MEEYDSWLALLRAAGVAPSQAPSEREQALAGLVKRLARRLHPEDNLRVTATEYLKEQGFFNPLRTSGVDVHGEGKKHG